MKKNEEIYSIRESNFELLRIIAQIIIIFYHLLYFAESQQIISGGIRALQMPFHSGVLLFVLISGYFGIKLSRKGVSRLLGTLAIYYIPVTIAYHCYKHELDFVTFFHDLFFLSHTPLWFVRTYFYLMLLSPMINRYLWGINKKERLTLIASLLFMSIWVATVILPSEYMDMSVCGGKNILNFILLYVLGNTMRCYKDVICKYSKTKLLLVWLLLQIISVGAYIFADSEMQRYIIRQICYPYNSPLLYLNALLFFAFFMQINLRNQLVNKIATSVLSVYVLHSTPVIFGGILIRGCEYLSVFSSNIYFVCLTYALYAILIFATCVLIDYVIKSLLSKFRIYL